MHLLASKHPFSPSMLKSYNIERIRRISRAKYFLYQDKERTINHLHRYLDESFPELVPFLRKRGDIKRYQGRNFFDSKTTLWFVENFPSAKKFSNARSETAEKLRRMSKGAFSLIKFNELRNIAKNSIGVSFQETEEIIIGDITPYDNENKQKIKQNGQKAVLAIFKKIRYT